MTSRGARYGRHRAAATPTGGATLSEHPARSEHRPNPSAPPACKLRLRYARRGKLRFTSHRDVARAIERGLRRAGLPMAYSQGFNPHPRISWVGAAPTGCASEAEYLELQLVEPVDPELVRSELDAALPEGLAVLEAVRAGPGSLAERIEASKWHIELPGVPVEQLRVAVGRLLAAPQVHVQRMTKDGLRVLDARPALVSLRIHPHPVVSPTAGQVTECGILVVVVRHASPAVRPDDVLSALGVVAGLQPTVPAKVTRMAQGRLDDDGDLVDPLDRDRKPDGSRPEGSGDDAPRLHPDGVAGHAG